MAAAYPFDSPRLRNALRAWMESQPSMGGFTAYYHRLMRLLDEEPDLDVLEAMDRAHSLAMREVPTLLDSIEMAAYAASSYLEGYADALHEDKQA